MSDHDEYEWDADSAWKSSDALCVALAHVSSFVSRQLDDVTMPEMPPALRGQVESGIALAQSYTDAGVRVGFDAAKVMRDVNNELGEQAPGTDPWILGRGGQALGTTLAAANLVNEIVNPVTSAGHAVHGAATGDPEEYGWGVLGAVPGLGAIAKGAKAAKAAKGATAAREVSEKANKVARPKKKPGNLPQPGPNARRQEAQRLAALERRREKARAAKAAKAKAERAARIAAYEARRAEQANEIAGGVALPNTVAESLFGPTSELWRSD